MCPGRGRAANALIDGKHANHAGQVAAVSGVVDGAIANANLCECVLYVDPVCLLVWVWRADDAYLGQAGYPASHSVKLSRVFGVGRSHDAEEDAVPLGLVSWEVRTVEEDTFRVTTPEESRWKGVGGAVSICIEGVVSV